MRILVSAALLSLTCPTFAQAPPVTSPPGYLTTEAGLVPGITVNQSRSCYFFGAYPIYETQIFDAHMRGKSLRIIKQLDYRADFRAHNNSRGRTWTNVTLKMSSTRYDGNVSTSFSLNPIGTPTTVFNASVTWPTITGYPHGNNSPNKWAAEVSFPFSRGWIATNVNDILHHYKFTGGTLAGAGTWNQTTPSYYFLDSAFNGEGSTGYQYIYSSGSPGCRDSNKSQNGIAYMYAQTFAKQVFNTANNGNLKLDTRVFHAGPNATVVLAYSLGRANIPFPGVTCQNLGINVSTMVTFTQRASSNGYSVNRMAFPYNPIMDNVRVYMQVAWADTKTGGLLLSRQSLIQIQKQPPGKMRVLYQPGTAKAVLNMSMQRIPLTRYSFQ